MKVNLPAKITGNKIVQGLKETGIELGYRIWSNESPASFNTDSFRSIQNTVSLYMEKDFGISQTPAQESGDDSKTEEKIIHRLRIYIHEISITDEYSSFDPAVSLVTPEYIYFLFPLKTYNSCDHITNEGYNVGRPEIKEFVETFYSRLENKSL